MTQIKPDTPQKLQKFSPDKREYYAAMALQALITKDDDPLTAALLQHRPEEFDLTKLEWYAQLKAKAAVIYADALRVELDQ